MTFLNPLALVGLIAAVIPILLHILNLRKVRRIEFSTVAFLKELQRSAIRRLKLRQWILLLLRTLIVASVVLAFARPALKGTLGTGGGRARTSMVLMIDNSLSMSARDNRGEFLAQAKSAARRILSAMQEGDDVAVIRTGDPGSSQLMELTRNRDLLRAVVDETSNSATRASIPDAVRLAAKLLEASTNVNREIYVISDMQRSSFPPAGPSVQILPPTSSLFFNEVGKEVPSNAAVDSVSVANQILQAGLPFSVEAGIRNEGSAPLRGEVMSVFLNGTRIAQRSVDVPPSSERFTDVPVIARAPGFQAGKVAIEGDGLEADNERHFCVSIPRRYRVLIIGQPGDELTFVRLALRTAAGSDSSSMELVDLPPVRLASLDLFSFNVVVASGLPVPALPQLRQFLERGGGLVLFPRQVFSPGEFNAVSAALGLPRAVGLKPVAGGGGTPAAGTTPQSTLAFSEIDFAHPLFAGVFEDAVLNQASHSGRIIESPVIERGVEFSTGPLSLPVIQMTGRLPFLIDQPVGDGRAILFAVSPTSEWSDFPFKPVFAPLLYRSIVYVSSSQRSVTYARVGEESEIRLPSSAAGRGGPLTVSGPKGIQVFVQPVVLQNDALLRVPGLPLPGVYYAGNGTTTPQTAAAALVVNIDPAEVDLARIKESDATALLERIGVPAGRIRFVSPQSDILASVRETRYGTELWSGFAILALLCAVLELIVARSGKQDRRGEGVA